PLPFLPLNMLMRSSPTISGHISGSILSGVRLTNVTIKGTPSGIVKCHFINFRYRGVQYLLHHKLIIDDLSTGALTIDLPNGSFTNWPDIKRQIQRRLFLVPSIPRPPLSEIHIVNTALRNNSIRVGKPLDLLGWLQVMMPEYFAIPPSPSKNSTQGPQKFSRSSNSPQRGLHSLRINHLEIVNSSYQSQPMAKPSLLAKFIINDMTLGTNLFHVGNLEAQSNKFLLAFKPSKQAFRIEAMVADINGVVKKE